MDTTARMSFEQAERWNKQLKNNEEGRYKVAPKEQRTAPDGTVFHSKREMQRYLELLDRQERGHIRELTLQPEFTLQPKFWHEREGHVAAVRYRADFSYYERDDGFSALVVEDVKGHRTEVYRIKRKLMLYHYSHVTFREVT